MKVITKRKDLHFKQEAEEKEQTTRDTIERCFDSLDLNLNLNLNLIFEQQQKVKKKSNASKFASASVANYSPTASNNIQLFLECLLGF